MDDNNYIYDYILAMVTGMVIGAAVGYSMKTYEIIGV